MAAGPDGAIGIHQLLAKSALDPSLRGELVSDAEAVLDRVGMQVPPGVQVHVVESVPDEFIIALPPLVQSSDNDAALDEDALADVSGGVTPAVILGLTGGGSLLMGMVEDDIPRGRKPRR